MLRRLTFETDGRDWPNRAASRFIEAAGLRWHVQRMGAGPTLVLAHGTGASTHSWRDMLPILARDFDTVAFDLPGHGFTDALPGRATLPSFSSAVSGLLTALGVRPALCLGHSAGTAVLIQMSLDRLIEPAGIVGLNPALLPFRGFAAHIFGPMAKIFALNPLVPRFVAATTDLRGAERLIRNTGSTIEPEGVALYARLVASPAHVAGALAMMADWDLGALADALPRLAVPLHQIIGGNDRAVPPSEAERVRDILLSATVEYLRGLGHLAHEERPSDVAARVKAAAERFGVLGH